MWTLMNFIPENWILYVIDAALIAGAVSSFITIFLLNRLLRWFPGLTIYHLPLQVISIALLVVGIYYKGGYNVEMIWRARVDEVEKKLAIAEAKSQKANVEIQKVFVDRVKVVRDHKVVVEEKIKVVEKLIDSECKIVPEAINILNDSAKGPAK